METVIPNTEIRDKICDIINLAYDLKGKGHDLFFEYAAHVNLFEIRLHVGGWHASPEPHYVKNIYFDVDTYHPEKLFDVIIEDIKKAVSQREITIKN